MERNQVILEPGGKIESPGKLKYSLTTLFKQQPNGRWLLTPTEKIYEKNQERIRAGKPSKRWRERRGEELVIHDPSLTEEARRDMINFLQNQGYFEAEVQSEVAPFKKEGVSVKYKVKPGERYLLNTVGYSSSDTLIHQILQELAPETLLKKSTAVSKDNFDADYRRIAQHLRTRGYARLDQTFFKATGDSTGNQVHVEIEVLPPPGASTHTVFRVGEVSVFPRYTLGADLPEWKDSLISGIHFKTISPEYQIKPATIIRNIFLEAGDLVDERALLRTRTKLSDLNAFRIVNVQSVIREDDPTIMDFEIFLTPRKKMSFQMDLEVNNSQGQILGAETNLIGTSLNSNFKNYNSFRNASIFDLSLGGGIEFNLANLDSLIYSSNFTGRVGLSFPKYIKWIGPQDWVYSIFSKKKSEDGDEGFYSTFRERARTNISTGYEYVNIFNFYDFHRAELEWGYESQINRNSNLRITQTGFTFFLPETRPNFDSIALENPYLQRSFDRQLFTGLLFRNATYSFNAPPNPFGGSWGFLGELDVSGFEMFLANKLYNDLGNNTDTIRVFDRIDFSQFIKLQAFANYTRKFKLESAIAFRLNMGVVRPFGYSKESGVPFVEQLTAGGPNSMRGWRIRELGPGGYIDPSDEDTRVFVQSGEFKMEANFEYRTPNIWYLEGALFADVGNVWTLTDDEERPNSQFRFQGGFDGDNNPVTPFYEQLAIASGIGIRLDVSFFIVRWDIALKVRSPYEVDGSYWFPNIKPFNFWQTPNHNIAIAYPF
ncbi:MAG: BamA/TamA family outer membrane protein [Saprospiraceae bacterium]|nr:BamA/TamA family outer membrane protein [Saprospiraceae bacterium]